MNKKILISDYSKWKLVIKFDEKSFQVIILVTPDAVIR